MVNVLNAKRVNITKTNFSDLAKLQWNALYSDCYDQGFVTYPGTTQ